MDYLLDIPANIVDSLRTSHPSPVAHDKVHLVTGRRIGLGEIDAGAAQSRAANTLFDCPGGRRCPSLSPRTAPRAPAPQ